MSTGPMDSLENYLKQQPLSPDYNYPDLEEAALHDVIKISSPCVEPIVNRIESEYHTTKKTVEASYQKAKEQLNNDYKSEISRLQPDIREKIEKIQKDYDEEKLALITRTKAEKQKAASNAETQLDEFKENYEYEMMVAEVVEEGNLKKCKNNLAEIKKSVASAKSELDELNKTAEQILSDYNIAFNDSLSMPPDSDIETKHDPMEFFQQQKKFVELHLHVLSRLFLPKLFLNPSRYIIAALICIIFTITIWLINRNLAWKTSHFALILSGGLVLLIILLIISEKLLRKKALSQVRQNFHIITRAIDTTNAALDKHLQNSLERIKQNILHARQDCQNEKHAATEKYEKSKAAEKQKSENLIKNAEEKYSRQHGDIQDRFSKQLAQIELKKDEKQKACKKEYDEKLNEINKNFTQKIDQIETEYNSDCQRLKEYWLDRLNTVKKMLDETQNLDQALSYDWQNPEWSHWNPEKTQKRLIRFGKIELDFKQIAEPVRQLMETGLKDLDTVTLPATLAFPNRCSLLIQTSQNARDSAINLVKAVMARLFTSVPAGQVHFNIFDPIGLGKNFVGFMHAVDYHKVLVGGRIWTDSEHIQRCLTELTTHMENVIQKYLRNEFETIEAYNQQAGELAEPYRFLVIADFPTNFTDESLRRLTSIINSGPRCGVYTLIVSDQAQKLPEGISARELELNGVHLVHHKGHLVWQNEILKNFPLEPDSPPSEELLTDLVCKVGMASVDSSRVEVPFDSVTPSENDQWNADSTFDIKIPIGRAGAKRLQYLQLGKGVNQHMLIAGKTGSGKSTLFHIIISNLALWYSPDEVELYLIDFKEGVEFKSYAAHKLPHARVVAIESDREFGLSILQRLDEEMNIRGEKFRLKRVQDISSYRQATGEKMPRTILIIDEFHVLFTDDDKIAQDSTILLEKLVRQGRAFGIHIILGSQSLAGTSGIPRSIMGQMAVRIALQCSEMDSQVILNEDNVVARLLSRPGEAIYNDAGGMVVGNNPFQVAWLPKITQDQYLESIHKFQKQLVLSHEPMIIFEGNIPADISNNSFLAKAMQNPFKNNNPAKHPPCAWLGEPVTIKDPTAVVWTRQNGANLLIVGQQDFAMTGILSSALLSLLLQLSPEAAKFTILDGSPPDSSINAKLKTIDSFFPHKCRFPKPSKIKDVIPEVALEVQKRLDDSSYDSTQTQFLFISGLQRLRMLYRNEDDWSVRPDEKTLSIDRQLADIIRGGPSVGIHTILAADTFNTVERVVDRQTLREFNNRVLLQMSASDSSNLIDSPVANQLGPQRVLFYNDELGILEKFRFYAPPDKTWLKKLPTT